MGKFLESEKQNQIWFKNRSDTITPEARVDGIYKGKPRPFCLPVELSEQNLFFPIRETATSFIRKKKIRWHDGHNNKPSNHLCDSQVFCVNFLFPFADKPEELAKLLHPVFPKIKRMLPVEDKSFVSFEWIGNQNYLGERVRSGKSRTRGTNCTSVDAIVRFESVDHKIQVVLIEWKYTESYASSFKRYSNGGTDRGSIYKHLFDPIDCPINKEILPGYDALFYEPFYQLMRQQLLAHEMEKAHELGADIVSVLHIAPFKNQDFTRITSPSLTGLGESATEVWEKLVKPEERFRSVHTEYLFREFFSEKMDSWKMYLQARYDWLIKLPKLTPDIAERRQTENGLIIDNWSEGVVDRKEEHLKLWYEDNKHPTALVTNIKGKGIIVQFAVDINTTSKVKEAVTRELNFYFNELNKQNPWGYAIYHCSTSSNIYSDVHWGYFPKGWQPR